ncbi:MAG: type II toxin-antitoxin system RelE/ParE family toxin [Peptococcaceae bacterium]|nr:type II toxin-antitoxin system RelE/ParE family toxin [Peptococcaceae bacterium]
MIPSYRIIYSQDAVEDIQSIYFYIAYELLVPDIAEQQVNRIRNGIQKLDTMPFRHPVVDWEPWNTAQMHQFPVDNYIIFYQIDKDNSTVNIVRIFYAGKDIKYIVTLNDE